MGKTPSTVLWSSWEDYDEEYLSAWPWIIGKMRIGEIAFVLEVKGSKSGFEGARVFTQTNLVGWISLKCLKKIVIPVGVDPTPP